MNPFKAYYEDGFRDGVAAERNRLKAIMQKALNPDVTDEDLEWGRREAKGIAKSGAEGPE